MTIGVARSAAEKNYREAGVYELSVFASEDLDVAGIVLAAREDDPRALPHNKLQTSPAKAIRSAGCQLVYSEPPRGHCSLTFSTPPTDRDFEALLKALGEPIANPFPLSRR